MDKLWPFEGTDSYKGHYQCPPPLIYRPRWGPKGRKNFFLRPQPLPPAYLRVWMTAPPPLQVNELGFPISSISRCLSRQEKKKGKERDFCQPLSKERELRLILKRDRKMIGRTLDKRRWKFTSLGALALRQKPPCFNVRAHKGIYIANAFQIWSTLDGYKVLAAGFEPTGCSSVPRDFTASCFLFRLIFWLIMVGGHKLV